MDWLLGDVQKTKNPGLLLQGAFGTFKVTGPAGEVNLYECKQGYSIKSIVNIDTVEPRNDGFFLVEKIGEQIVAAEPIALPATNLRHRTARA